MVSSEVGLPFTTLTMPLDIELERLLIYMLKIVLLAGLDYSMLRIDKQDAEPQERDELVMHCDYDCNESEIKTRHLRVGL